VLEYVSAGRGRHSAQHQQQNEGARRYALQPISSSVLDPPTFGNLAALKSVGHSLRSSGKDVGWFPMKKRMVAASSSWIYWCFKRTNLDLKQDLTLDGLFKGEKRRKPKKKKKKKKRKKSNAQIYTQKRRKRNQPTLLQLSHQYSTPLFFIFPPTIGIGISVLTLINLFHLPHRTTRTR